MEIDKAIAQQLKKLQKKGMHWGVLSGVRVSENRLRPQ